MGEEEQDEEEEAGGVGEEDWLLLGRGTRGGARCSRRSR